jgi:DNA (cytosine-5)-methyltransferase 1
MRRRSTLLDLFCCAGGAGVGYARAGFDVTGVDIRPQPNYPGRFIQADAVAYAAAHGAEYDVRHASPPCQGYTELNHVSATGSLFDPYPRLIEPIRAVHRSGWA